MADEPQTLQEFTESLLSDLTSGAITVHEALAACQQYAYLRDAIESQTEELSRAEALGEDRFAAEFARVISEVKASIADLPNFHRQKPDAPLPEPAIRDRGALRQYAVARLRETRAAQTTALRAQRREFIHALVSRFGSVLPIDETPLDAAVDTALLAASKEPADAQARRRFTDTLLSSLTDSGATVSEAQQAALKNDVERVVEGHNDFFAGAVNLARRDLPIYTALLENGELARPDVFIDIAINAPAEERIDSALTRAAKLAQVAEALEAPSRGGGRIRFFSDGGTRGVAAGIQKGADTVLSLIGEPVRGALLRDQARGALRSVLANTQATADRLGEAFVKSALFTHIAQDLTRQLAEKPSGGRVRTVFDDVLSAVFRGPLDPALSRSAQNRVLDYFELARANAAAPKGRAFLPPGPFPWGAFQEFASFSAGFSGGASGRGASWSTRAFPSLGLFGLGALGSLLGGAATTFVDRITSFFFSSPAIGRQMAASRRAAAVPTPLADDMPTVVALVVVATIVLLFLLPTPFNITQNSHSSKVSALFSSLRPIGALFSGADTDCSTNPDSPLCSFKSCPTCSWPTSGYITQGPSVSCDTKVSHASGNDRNGIDIAQNGDVPVYAIEAGTVTYVYSGCGEGGLGDNCGGASRGYGNNVVIRFDNGYTVIYGHLSTSINPAVRVGARVTKGMQIGWMNHSGNSSGQHLHFGVISGGNVLDILPDGPLSKEKISGCVAGWLSPSCRLAGKSCPTDSVRAQ